VKILPAAFKQKTNSELEAEIQRREIAEKRLAEANTGLQAFAYIASHDLQEPLRKIRTYSSMLFDANAEKYDEKSKDYANKIVNSSKKMQLLIQDVLSLSSISDTVEFSPTDLEKCVHNANDDLEIKILEKNAVIDIEPLPPVIGNDGLLTQLFVNLIGNSLKFSIENPVIKITGETHNNKVIIKVQDNGIGMEPSETSKIFNAFHRLHTKNKYEGSGIGLAICKKIVDVHQGNISVESIEGTGTTFIIELPSA
jgi:light-regulated signal transduction histidine kinase (bacteriophytochrome)